MLLSIIIPYYNADAWIGKMLDSLLEQDIAQDDYEIIVVDDSSTQEPVVLRDYVARFPHIHYYRIAHCGMGPVRNYGMSLAKGDWIYFCDADDFLQPHVLRGIIAAAEERDLEMILANHVKINENDPIPTPRRNFDKLSDTMTGLQYFAKPTNKFSWGVWAFVTRRSVYESNGLAFEDVCFVEDRLFKFALMRVVTRCATIDVDLYYYVQHESSISTQSGSRTIRSSSMFFTAISSSSLRWPKNRIWPLNCSRSLTVGVTPRPSFFCRMLLCTIPWRLMRQPFPGWNRWACIL